MANAASRKFLVELGEVIVFMQWEILLAAMLP